MKNLARLKKRNRKLLSRASLLAATKPVQWLARALLQPQWQVNTPKTLKKKRKQLNPQNLRQSKSTGRLGKRLSPSCSKWSTTLASMSTRATVSPSNQCKYISEFNLNPFVFLNSKLCCLWTCLVSHTHLVTSRKAKRSSTLSARK